MGKIANIYNKKKTVLSCEIFPPKKEADFLNLHDKIEEISALEPDFLSVTYGAGGSNAGKAVEIADFAKNKAKIEVLSHITSVGFNREKLEEGLKRFKEIGVENVLVLRGDRPKDMTDEEFNSRDFAHANEMAAFIREKGFDFSIAGACYPHKHPESATEENDISNTKLKVESGCDFLISQLFFDNEYFLRLQDRLSAIGVNVPISAGIMPITSAKQLGTTVTLSGTTVPEDLSDIIAKYGDKPDEMRKYGIEYAIKQAEDLIARGTRGIHLYIMNKPELLREIFTALK